ncbi:unnamed protein product [Euphydryas editha]|uniref:Uncharacterized protein n=1 Tax=Euphydryas editha TaxID=104508 RepID=A0AAU9TI96_EUPED|nr:unnamed protein product [Euphydryas editha]
MNQTNKTAYMKHQYSNASNKSRKRVRSALERTTGETSRLAAGWRAKKIKPGDESSSSSSSTYASEVRQGHNYKSFSRRPRPRYWIIVYQRRAAAPPPALPPEASDCDCDSNNLKLQM